MTDSYDYCPRCGGDIHTHVLSTDPHDRDAPDVYLCADQLDDLDE